MPERLAKGFEYFKEHDFPSLAEHFKGLAHGQHPRAIFITCSDSRISPSLLTHSAPGTMFVIRNAGNIVPPTGNAGGEAATLEYGIRVLKIPAIIVCGHSNCGAMSAVLEPNAAKDLPNVRVWVTNSTRALDRVPDGPDRLDRLIEQNVLLQIEHLRTYDFVREAEAAGELRLIGWVYRFETGELFAFDSATKTFVPITELAEGEVPT